MLVDPAKPAPELQPHRVVFAHAVEALFTRAFRPGEVSPRCRERLRRVGIDLDRPLLPCYPDSVWLAALEVAVAELFPEQPRDEGYRELGRRLVTGYVETVIGRAILTLARIAGPRRTLLRVQHNLRSATNYVDTRLVEHAVNDFELWVGSHAHPAYHQGVFEAMLDVIGQRGYDVVPEHVDAEGVTYRIRWES